MLIALSVAIISIGAILFFSRRLLCYLRHFQEVNYSKNQFKDWILENGIYDKKGSGTAAIAALAIELTKEKIILSLLISTIATIGLIWMSLAEDDPIETGSFKLQMTKQASGIYNIALALYSILVMAAFWTTYLLGADDDIACYWLVVIIVIQSSPIWLILSNSLWKRI
jgi:hypothetical protein